MLGVGRKRVSEDLLAGHPASARARGAEVALRHHSGLSYTRLAKGRPHE
jgi:hypothetical protein